MKTVAGSWTAFLDIRAQDGTFALCRLSCPSNNVLLFFPPSLSLSLWSGNHPRYNGCWMDEHAICCFNVCVNVLTLSGCLFFVFSLKCNKLNESALCDFVSTMCSNMLLLNDLILCNVQHPSLPDVLVSVPFYSKPTMSCILYSSALQPLLRQQHTLPNKGSDL